MKTKLLLLILLAFVFTNYKARANESEPNNSWNQASTLALNGTNNGDMNPAADIDWWKVKTSADGAINLSLTSTDGRNIYFDLYDTLGTIVLHNNTYTNGTTNYTVDGLAQGTYYIKIYCYYGTDTGRYTISNTLTVPTQANDAEPDSTRAQAIAIPLNGGKTGHIDYYYNHHRDSLDMYKVTTNGDGALKLVLTAANGQNVYFQLYDNDATTLLHSDYTAGTFNYTVDGLAAGTYYIKIFTYYNTGFAPYTISDTLIKPTQANDVEPDSTRAQAIVLPLDGSKTGHIDYYYNHHRDSLDVYQVTTNADGALRLSMSSGNGQNIFFQLYDNDEKTLLHSEYTAGNYSYTVDGLAAGTYYIKVFTYYNTGFAPYTISDSLFLPAIANDAEPDSSKATALTLPLDGSVTGHIGYYYNNHRDSVDEYKLTTNADGNINLNLTSANGTNVWFSLYDNNGTTLIYQTYTAGNANYNVDGLSKGTYYVKVFTYYNGQFAPYTLKDTLSTYNANDVEPNKYAKQAKTLNSNLVNNGHVGFYYNLSKDTTDWFKINYTGTGSMSVALNVIPNITGPQQNTWMQIYKDTAVAPIYSAYTTTTETASLTGLAEGYYYVKIFEYYNTFTAYTVTPTFTQTDVAFIKPTSYDTAASCDSTNNSITFMARGSHAPYTIQLFRFGTAYGNAVTTTKTYTFDSLPTGSYYAVAYGDGATGSAFGRSKSVSLEQIPTGLSTTNIAGTQAKLNWTSVSCAAYFTIRYKVDGTGTWKTKKTKGNVTSFVLRGLTVNTTYDWEVASDDSANGITAISLYADSIKFTTAASLIAGIDDNEDNLSINNGSNNSSSLMVAPNPATSVFTIHYNTSAKQQLAATLYDVNGKPVWTSGSLASDALNGKQVNVSQFGSGLYYLKITDDKGNVIATTKLSVIK